MPIQEAVKIKKVLLVYITKVSGHRQATVAIHRFLKKENSEIQIRSVNGFGYVFPLLEKVVNKAYMSVIKRTPQLWEHLYDNPKVIKKSSLFKDFLHKTSHSKLSKLFREFRPDAVVCTQAFPCGMIADFKKAHNLDIKLIAVLTDHAPHAYWINEGVDYYVVPSQQEKNHFINDGIPAERIKTFGIPIRPRFLKTLDKKEIAQKLGLDPVVPTVLVMGGGQGLGPIKSVVKALVRMEKDVQLVVITGINIKLMRWLEKISPKTNKKMVAYSYADHVEELMEVATLIITKPGGITTSEALSKGLPMVIINPIPGQEVFNTNFLLEKGIAIRVDHPEKVGESVRQLLSDPHQLESMKKAALENARPHAARDIARLVLE